ncbi:hypothetical protein MOQ_002300 [Trypanosoma cruzi marinkellei]|uniref:Importin N-terminal domain-containing protein n=1 Tax=Trypanosoma cruzi marinkellei TaxID=85056 RepID=K2NML8_TRYCR|nr:hypothetical protein MOQ_002300 [Trypanosoma cruzi marinkellei]
MENHEVAEVDLLAEQLYTDPDPTVRRHAQASLELLAKEEADSHLHYTIFRQSNSQYTLLLVAQSIVSWFRSTRKWMSLEEQRELIVVHCGGCLTRMFDRGAPKHVVSSLLTAYARLTKLAFENEPLLEAAVDFPLEMLMRDQKGSSEAVLSLMLLNVMVQEFSRHDASKSQTFLSFVAHRHCSGNFREGPLLKIFLAALKQLEGITTDSANIAEVVKLLESCLTFDFRAIMMDETEGLPFSQFPASWKSTLLNKENLGTVWGQHAMLPYPHCATLLSGIVNICSVHRTLFDSSEERGDYLEYTLTMLTEVTMIQDGRLKIPHYVELFAEACTRVLTSFGYRELRPLNAFEPWVNAVHMLSVEVVSIPFGQEGSFSTASSILSFWVTLTTSKRRAYHDPPQRDIEDVVTQLLQNFIKARICNLEMNAVDSNSLINGDSHDLNNSVIAQSASYATICLLDPLTCVNDLVTCLNQHVGASILSSPLSTGWLFYIAGSLVGPVMAAVEDGGVTPCSHVLAFVVWCATSRLRGGERDPAMFGPFVECGLLQFLTHLQTFFSGACQGPLAAIVTNVFENHSRMFQFILDSAGHNLLRGAEDARAVEIIRTSAAVITAACRDATPELLRDLTFDLPPSSELPLAQSERTYKLRTDLMKALWFIRRSEPTTYEQMTSYLSGIEANMQQTLNNELTSTSFVAGWLRDLRGACQAMNDEGTLFSDFLEWVCGHSHVFVDVLNKAGESPVIVNALMRFLCELVVTGRYGRFYLRPSGNSAVGLVLFVNLCGFIEKVEEAVFSDYRIAALGESSSDYEKSLKPWMLSMNIMTRCIRGSFVPFGAMMYYNDRKYENNAFHLVRKLTMLEANVFRERAKFTAAALDLLRSMTEEQLYFPLTHLESNELLKLVEIVVSVCEEADTPPDILLHGLSFLGFIAGLVRDVKVILFTPTMQPSSSGAAPPPLSLSHSFVPILSSPSPASRAGQSTPLSRLTRETNEKLARLLAPHQDLWQHLISVAMGIIAYRDHAVSASSGVVYPIFEAHPPFWYNFVEQFVASYPKRKQLGIREALSILTNASESQEKFFSEVFTFRQALRRLNT